MRNRSMHGVFVSMDAEEYANGTYGNILLTIDLESFLKESGLGELDIDLEPEYMEYLLRSSMSSSLDLEYNGDIPSDISMNTLIVGHKIPIKYIGAS